MWALKIRNYSSHAFSRSTGFTLLELLIAMSLSAVLMTVLVVGLKQISRDWEKVGERLDQKIDESLLLLQLEKAILGTYAYHYKEKNLAKEELFFEGSKTELSWVSTVSPGRNSSLTFWHLEMDEDRGFRLNVLPVYPGNLYQQLEKVQADEQQKFFYFQDYKISLQYLVETTNKKKQWESNWSGKEKKQFPLGVRIKFEEGEQDSEQELNFSVFSFIRASADGSAAKSRGFFGGGTQGNIPDADSAAGSNTNPLQEIFNTGSGRGSGSGSNSLQGIIK